MILKNFIAISFVLFSLSFSFAAAQNQKDQKQIIYHGQPPETIVQTLTKMALGLFLSLFLGIVTYYILIAIQKAEAKRNKKAFEANKQIDINTIKF